uniref:Acyl-activating enzyme 17 family protein n=1 Tax=Rhizophora mucronata TaxID=61149 RepID=A0A2P2KZU9_RHIMU
MQLIAIFSRQLLLGCHLLRVGLSSWQLLLHSMIHTI